MSRTISLVLAVAMVVASRASALASCVAPGGAGGCFASIQAAVDAAARNEVIDVMAGTYAEAVSVAQDARLTLHGAGVGSTVIDGAALTSPIVFVQKNARMSIEDMTLQNGTAGGGIFVSSARLTISRCRLTGNRTGGGGAVRMIGGHLTVVDTTLDGNQSTQGFGDGGGAIFVGASVGLGKLELRRSTVSGNSAANEGGGLMIQSRGRALIVDSTMSGNTAPAGGAVVCSGCRRLTLVNCTVTANSSTGPVSAINGAVVAGGTTMQWANSIVADNTSASGGPECSGNLRSRGYNLIGGPGLTAETVGCNLVTDDATSLIGVDPMLGPLANNGGPTQTHALLAGSPAIDAGDPRPPADHATRCPTTDQRGVARNGRCDIGAYEF